MKALFRDPIMQTQLENDGYAVLPFLDQYRLEKLRSFYDEIHPGGNIPNWIEGIHMTSWCQDLKYKLRVKQTCSEVTAHQSNEIFNQCRFLNHVFIIKQNGRDTSFKVHQDWNVVDESKFSSVNIWIPLWDVDSTNGALWILPGSHRIKRPIRGAGYLFPDYSAHLSILHKSAKSIRLQAGEAVVFYHNVIHGSPPNLGNRHRVALAFSAIPESAPLSIYFQKSAGDLLQLHEPDDDFMYHYQHLRTETFEKPPTEKPKMLLPTYENKPVKLDELRPFLNSTTLPKKKIWWKIWT